MLKMKGDNRKGRISNKRNNRDLFKFGVSLLWSVQPVGQCTDVWTVTDAFKTQHESELFNIVWREKKTNKLHSLF